VVSNTFNLSFGHVHIRGSESTILRQAVLCEVIPDKIDKDAAENKPHRIYIRKLY
jgi:hypothetical protein